MKTKEKTWNVYELTCLLHLALEPLRHALDDAVKAKRVAPLEASGFAQTRKSGK